MDFFFFFSFSFLALLMAAACHSLGAQLQDQQFISWADLTGDLSTRESDLDGTGESGRVIQVSKDGSGDSRTVQGAVDMVPDGNRGRVKIIIFPGVYREKVIVPSTKPYVSFIGKGGSETVISWHLRASDRDSNGNDVGTMDSASVAVEANYFAASGITFENTALGATPGSVGMQAVALRLSGDKAMLYHCKILGLQDTLFDHTGRHFFYQCYIQGSIDFIFGNAKSLYQECTLHAVAGSSGAVAASQRNSLTDDTGFSFLRCKLSGSGMLFLGRAWGKYARVVYAYCQLGGIVVPEGWDDWRDPSRRRTVLFGEYNCTGKGADQSKRVAWARSLSYDQARPFLDRNYIDGNQWLRL